MIEKQIIPGGYHMRSGIPLPEKFLFYTQWPSAPYINLNIPIYSTT